MSEETVQPLREYDPVWAEAPRYCPTVKLPPYRYRRGLNPHPERDPDGHAHTAKHPEAQTLNRDGWQQNRAYLYGFDLYHMGYLWESHEAWESIWRKAANDSREGNFLQALILNAAALIKVNEGNARGAKRHSQEAHWRFARIESALGEAGNGMYMGVNLTQTLESLRSYYGPCWKASESEPLRVGDDLPRFDLVFED